jgi:hypothetical protein
MMLCDHAQVAGGKLFISGGGWGVTPTPTQPTAIALLLQVPWGEANRRLGFTLQLLDSDGQPVTQLGPTGQAQPVAVEGEVEVGRPPGLVEGSTLDVPLAFNIPSLLLQPDQRFVWELKIGDETNDGWQLSFQTRGIRGVSGS